MVSLREILENVKDDPMLKDLSFERALRYAVKLIRIVGVPQFFEVHSELVEVHNYKCLVPCDCISIIQIRDPKSNLCYRSAMETWHNQPGSASCGTYKRQGDVIFFSFKEGAVEIAFKKMFVDDEGFPMLEDNAAFCNALELFIKKEFFTVLFNSGKLDYKILQNTKQEYDFAISQAMHELSTPSKDEMQNILNILNTPVLNHNPNKWGYGKRGDFDGRRIYTTKEMKDFFGNKTIIH